MKAPVTTTTKNEDNVTGETASSKREIPKDLPFVIHDLHKKALLVLLHRHHAGIFLTYSQLSQEIGIGEKTKRWQCGAWKHLKKHGYIVPGDEKRTFGLSKKGIELAECFATDEELEDFKPPSTNEQLHEKIRKQLWKQKHKGKKTKGVQIFDLLLEATTRQISKTRLELAWELDCNPDSHGFFYGFSALQKMGLVQVTGNLTREELKRKWESMQLPKNNDDKREDESKDNDDKEDSAAAVDKNTARQEDNGTINKNEEYRDETEQEPKRKKRKKAVRIRGGTQLFALSEKAFLAGMAAVTENIHESTGATE